MTDTTKQKEVLLGVVILKPAYIGLLASSIRTKYKVRISVPQRKGISYYIKTPDEITVVQLLEISTFISGYFECYKNHKLKEEW